MKLSEFCIKRPVFTIVLSLLITIVGIISFQRLAVRELPKMDKPLVSVETYFPGADAHLVEKDVTTLIENALAGISGLQTMHSSSRMGASSLTLRFDLDTNIDAAIAEIRNKMAKVTAEFAQGVKTPVVSKMDVSNNPSLIISITDPNKTATQISDYILRYFKPRVQQIDGVGSVFLFGERDYAIRIWLDPQKMAARGVTTGDINEALAQQNISIPSGQIKGAERDYTIITEAKFTSLNDFKNLIIKHVKGISIRLVDVANVVVGSESIDSSMRVNGQTSVGVGIIPQTMANPIQISKDVHTALKQMRTSLPKGMQATVPYDEAAYIQQSINEVYLSLFEAVGFVTLVVFIFSRC